MTDFEKEVKEILYRIYSIDDGTTPDDAFLVIQAAMLKALPEKLYCEIHGKEQRRDKCKRCCEVFMYRQAISEMEERIKG